MFFWYFFSIYLFTIVIFMYCPFSLLLVTFQFITLNYMHICTFCSRSSWHMVKKLILILIVKSIFSDVGTSHLGTSQSLLLLQDWLWMPQMAWVIRRFIQGCRECSITKTPHHQANFPHSQFHVTLGHTYGYNLWPTYLPPMVESWL